VVTNAPRYNYPGVTNNIMVAPDTYAKLAAHPNIVGCKMSHGNVSHHVQVSLHPKIDHSKFRLFSGFGQQLFPIVISGAAGVIDGLAAFYPHTVVKLFELSTTLPLDAKCLELIHRIQFAVSSAEEMVGKFGIVGIKEAVYRVLGMGNLEGGRLPLRGRMPEGEWEKWSEVLGRMEQLEREFS
jgi:2-keto-3-deoxy-L-rhamnonate aldolase